MPDYAFYQTLGGQLSEEEFRRLCWRAWAYLEALTLGRVGGTLPTPAAERVKRACCALADEYAAQERGGELSGASNDGYSETYAGSGRTWGQRLYDAAAIHLAPTGLLYAGMGGSGCVGLH